MAQILTANLITESAEPGKESYEITWTIPNWQDVRTSEKLLNCQEALFNTGSSSTAWFKTKWLVGLKVFSSGYCRRKIRLYWKLLGITGPQEAMTMTLEAKLQTQVWNFRRNGPQYTDEKNVEVKLLEVVEESEECLDFTPESEPYSDRSLINGLGQIQYVLKLTLKTPTISTLEHHRYKMEQFSKKSVQRHFQNQAALLNNHSENADLKIVSSDGVEIPAHQTILRAHCPVFAAMLNLDLAENGGGIIRMTDLSEKTMKILLHYFYTGELLPSWRDPDTIVEFTYAAGKFEMTQVLELLDEILGEDASNLDVQLINLAGKLELKKAEERLLKRIVAKIKRLRTSEELFRFFGYDEEEVSEMAEVLATEQFGGSKILKLVDYMYGSYDSQNLYDNGVPLLALVRKEELKKVEKNLLKSFAQTAEKVKNADQLFSLFGRGKQLGK